MRRWVARGLALLAALGIAAAGHAQQAGRTAPAKSTAKPATGSGGTTNAAAKDASKSGTTAKDAAATQAGTTARDGAAKDAAKDGGAAADAAKDAGASAPGVSPTRVSVSSFECEDGTVFSASFVGAPASGEAVAEVVIDGRRSSLGERRVASGFHYADGSTSIRGKGSELVLEREGAAPTRCAEEPRSRVLRLEDRSVGMRFEYPASWDESRVATSAVAGSQADAQRKGATQLYAFDYVPRAAGARREPLARIAVYPPAVWKRLTAEPVQPEGEVLAETERRVFVGILPRSIPYPPGSADAAAFDSMAMNLAQLGASFSLVPEVAQAPRPRAVSGTVTYRQRIALPRDAVLVVELRDTSRADAPAVVLAERRIPVEGRQVPLPFELPLPSEPMRPGARTTLSARIYVGDRLAFINDRAVVPVLGADAPPTEIVVVPVGAPLPEPAKRGG